MKKLDVNICQKLREEGKSYQEIANYFTENLKVKVSKQAVYVALDKAGIPRKTKHSLHYEDWEKLYKSGIGINIIAQKYNCSTHTVYNHLSKKFVIERGQLMKKRGTQKPLLQESVHLVF